MLDRLNEAIGMIRQEVQKEHGEEGLAMEAGDEYGAVFNDGIIIIGMEEGRELKITVLAGEPYKFDYDLKLIEEGK